MLAIVPNCLSDEIYKRIDAFKKEFPEFDADRELVYEEMLFLYNEHGIIPDIVKPGEGNENKS